MSRHNRFRRPQGWKAARHANFKPVVNTRQVFHAALQTAWYAKVRELWKLPRRIQRQIARVRAADQYRTERAAEHSAAAMAPKVGPRGQWAGTNGSRYAAV